MKNPKIFLLSLLSVGASARIAVIENESEIMEIPRSQIKTYIQRGTLQENLKPVKPAKPGAMSDEELATIPERYLPPELQKKQKEIKARIEAQKLKAPLDISKFQRTRDLEVVKVKSKSQKIISLKIDEAVWVPPTAAVEDAILAPQQKLPEVELLESITIAKSGTVKKEIRPGEPREITEVFQAGKTKDPDRVPLLAAYKFYEEKDFATSLTLALDQLSNPKASAETKLIARYLLAHSLFQAGFFASAQPQLIELISTKLRRSALGMLTKTLEKTHDEGTANQVLAKISISQLPEEYRSLFSFHLGRILLNTGARDPALAAFSKVESGDPRFTEAQYFIGVIGTAELAPGLGPDSWEQASSAVAEARAHFEQALVASKLSGNADIPDLVNLSLGRLAYQVKQFNQALFYYGQVSMDSIFSRDSLYESAWALYRSGEYNRSLGMLHPLDSPYYQARDLPELWILRSLNYLKLCRFDEAKMSAGSFEKNLKEYVPLLEKAKGQLKATKLSGPSQLSHTDLVPWLKDLLSSDPVVQKDLESESLFLQESARLDILAKNLRISDVELRESASSALKGQLKNKISAIGRALAPYLETRVADVLADYSAQRERADFLRFEIYSQATRFPDALKRPEAERLIAKGEFLPGVFLKGHEILWKFSGEYWRDEIRGYDYFIPTECQSLKDSEPSAKKSS